jgi:hypothetical protein
MVVRLSNVWGQEYLVGDDVVFTLGMTTYGMGDAVVVALGQSPTVVGSYIFDFDESEVVQNNSALHDV